MKKLFILFSLLFLNCILFGQWVKLGEQPNVLMVENNVGYKFANHFVTPASGGIYKVYSTQNDWGTQTLVSDEVGEPYGYTAIAEMDFINASVGLRTLSNGAQGTYFNFEKTDNYGETWSSFGQPISDFVLADLYMVNDTLGYVAGNSYDTGLGELYKITESAAVKIFNVDTLGFNIGGKRVEFTDPSTGYIIVKDNNEVNYLFKTSDTGATWNVVFAAAENTLTSISFPDASTGYLSSSDGKVFKTIDGGTNWDDVSPESAGRINSIDFIADDIGYIGCDAGKIFRTLNGGDSWYEQVSGIYSNIETIKMIDLDVVYCNNYNGFLLKNSNALSISEKIDDNSAIIVYPNPANDFINVSLPNHLTPDNVVVYNQLGVKILSTSKTELNIRDLEPGFYFVVIYSNGMYFNTSFIKS